MWGGMGHAFHHDRIMSQHLPPFSVHGPDGEVSGFSVDLFHILEDRVEPREGKTPVVAVTMERLFKETQNGSHSIALAVGRNEKREKWAQWVGPYMTLEIGLIAKKGHSHKVTSVADLVMVKVGVVKNAVPEISLLKQGINPSVLRSDLYPQYSLQKLAAGRIDYMGYPLESAAALMIAHNLNPLDYEEVFRITEVDLYFVFSLDFPRQGVARYQKALEEFLKTPEYEELQEKYFTNAKIKRAYQ